MPDELKPCPNPKCNCPTPDISPFGSSEFVAISCPNPGCWMRGPVCRSEADAIAAWNELPRLAGTVYDGTPQTFPPLLTDVLVEMKDGTRFCCKHHAGGDVVFVNDESFKLPKGCRWWLWPGGGE